MKRFVFILLLFLSGISVSQTIVQEITANTTWTAANSPYILQGGNTTNEVSLYIHNDNQPVTLTIEAGVTIVAEVYRVNFGGGLWNDEPKFIQIGKNGAIKCNGTSANPVTFTSNEGTKDYDQWGAIYIESEANTDAVSFNHTVFEAAGFEFEAAVVIESGSPEFNYCTFRTNSRGIYAEETASPVITNSEFDDNKNDGIELQGGGAVITGNTFTDNGTAVDMWKNFPDEFVNNLIGDDQDFILPEEITENANVNVPGYYLSGGKAPYLLRYPININDISVNVRAATLTINKGVIIYGGLSTPIWPNTEPSYINLDTGGSIVVNGTESEPVLFTSDQEEKNPGQWGCINFTETSNTSGSLINYAKIEAAGFEFDAAIQIDAGSPTITNSTFENNERGVMAYEGAAPVIQVCKFNGNRRDGIELQGAGAVIKGCMFEDNDVAIDMWYNFPSVIEDNTIAMDSEIRLPEDIDQDYTLGIPGKYTNGKTAPYFLRHPSHTDRPAVFISNSNLTIQPGVEIRGGVANIEWNFEPAYIHVGESGSIRSMGNSDLPVLFTTVDEEKDPGHWGGIILNANSNTDNILFDYTIFEAAGHEFDGAVIVNGGSPRFSNCTFRYNHDGIFADSNSTPIITGGNFLSNRISGIRITGGASAEISGILADSSRYGIDLDNASANLSASVIKNCSNDGFWIDGGADITVTTTTFKDNSGAGIFIEDENATTITVTNSDFTGNDIGVDAYTASGWDITINNCSIMNNADKGVKNHNETVIDAKNNWWGDITGPYDPSNDSNDPTGLYNPDGLGDEVTDYVDYGDWLTFLETENPNILCIDDVPNDQGRWIHLCWSASSLDAPGSVDPIIKYSVWRKVDENNRTSQTPGSQSLLKGSDLESMMSDNWDFIHDVTAVPEFDTYYYVAPTLGDSNSTDIVYSTFLIIAHTSDPGVYYKSNPATGYSIDNLAPGIPGGLIAVSGLGGTNASLKWNRNLEKDLMCYKVYRDGEFIAETPDTFYTDSQVLEQQYTYTVSAVDFNGNESDKSSPADVVVGVIDQVNVPIEFSLSQNYPNPFNPATTIRFTLPVSSRVNLYLLNIAGEKIKTIYSGVMQAAYHSVNLDAENLASGVYLYVLEAIQLDGTNNFRSSRKMLLLK